MDWNGRFPRGPGDDERRLRFGGPLRTAAFTVAALLACALPASASASVAGGDGASAVEHPLGLVYQPPVRPSAAAVAQVEATAAALPASVDLTPKAMPVGNQGSVGSCAAWATDYGALGYWENAEGIAGGGLEPMYTYSQYVNAYDGGHDNGSTIDYHLQVAEQQGVDNQADYTQGNFDYRDLPPAAERTHAANWKLTTYSVLPIQQGSASTVTQQAIEGALAAGNPVVIGIPVYYNFWVGNGLSHATGGYYSGAGDTTFEGYHAIVALGYNSTGLRIQNSWSTGWGDYGYATLGWSWVNQHVFEAVSVGRLLTPGTPANTAAPTLTGTAQQGMTLTASTGSWNPTGTSYAYQWQRSTDAGTTWSSISGATAATYVPGTADLAVRLRVQVTATNGNGSAAVTSSAVGPVASDAPVNTGAPAVSGTLRQGQTLTATIGSWNPAGTSYGYQWQRSTDGGGTWASVSGATGASYLLASGDVGNRVRVQIHAVNAYGDRYAWSAAAGSIATAAPASSSLPTVSGSPVRGSTLTASAGGWTPAGTSFSYVYQWQYSSTAPGGWSNLAGATGPAYTIATNVEQLRLRVVVTAFNTYGSASAASAATTPVQASKPANTAAPAVSGTAKVGSTLTATPGTWVGVGNAYAYQWQRSTNGGKSWVEIAGATRSTYALASADQGATVRILVTATNADGTASVASSSVSVAKAATTSLKRTAAWVKQARGTKRKKTATGRGSKAATGKARKA